jgi:DNA-binding response OmpR family regulator
MNVLLVEDSDRVGAAIADVLTHHGFCVRRARTAGEGLAMLDTAVGVVVLDLGLPDRDGFDLCASIRRRSDVPIIIATARGELPDRVHGLHLGADDYLVKPFDIRELMARIHAVTRRAGKVPGERPGERVAERPVPEGGAGRAAGVARFGSLVIDRPRRGVEVDGRAVTLTRKEFDLLELLAERPGVVYRREQILSAVWQSRWAGAERTLEVHVASIRSKTGLPRLIETVRGVGYRLCPGPSMTGAPPGGL